MDAINWLVHGVHGDRPACASPAISSFVMKGNDSMPDDTRQRLLAFLPRIAGSRSEAHEEARVAIMVIAAQRWAVAAATEAAAAKEAAAVAAATKAAATTEAAKWSAEAAAEAATAKRSEAVAAARRAAWAAAAATEAAAAADGEWRRRRRSGRRRRRRRRSGRRGRRRRRSGRRRRGGPRGPRSGRRGRRRRRSRRRRKLWCGTTIMPCWMRSSTPGRRASCGAPMHWTPRCTGTRQPAASGSAASWVR